MVSTCMNSAVLFIIWDVSKQRWFFHYNKFRVSIERTGGDTKMKPETGISLDRFGRLNKNQHKN